ncbi:hypothetical protein LguiA_019575 [Lonicera macranthoides]
MASSSGRRFLQSSARSFLNSTPRRTLSPPSVASRPSRLGGLAPTMPNPAPRRQPFFSSSRLPVELGGAVSLMPLHSVTASALLKSLLASKVGQWGCLSEGFATPL